MSKLALKTTGTRWRWASSFTLRAWARAWRLALHHARAGDEEERLPVPHLVPADEGPDRPGDRAHAFFPSGSFFTSAAGWALRGVAARARGLYEPGEERVRGERLAT